MRVLFVDARRIGGLVEDFLVEDQQTIRSVVTAQVQRLWAGQGFGKRLRIGTRRTLIRWGLIRRALARRGHVDRIADDHRRGPTEPFGGRMPANILTLLVLDKPFDGKLRAVGDHAVLGRSTELRPIGLGFSRKCDEQATRKGAPYKSVRKCVTLNSGRWIHILFYGML